MLRNHRLISVLFGHCTATLDKHGKQVGLAVRVVLLYIIIEPCASVTDRHVGRIGHNHIILPLHRLRDVDEGQQLRHGSFQTGAVHRDLLSGIRRRNEAAQQFPVVALHLENGAVLLGIP